ncbi:MAG: rod shape-determining protein RodA [Bacteroidota bacterium]
MSKQRGKIIKQIDWFSIVIYLLLMIIGWFSILSSSWGGEHDSFFEPGSRQMKQLVWIAASIVIIFIIFLIDSKFFSAFAYFLYVVSMLSLVAVLVFGKEVNGAKSWFEFGFFRFQPAEFAKIFTALALAQMFSSYQFRLDKFRHLLIGLLVMIFPMLLIILQNDTGSALVYTAFILVFYREGMNQILLFVVFLAVALFLLSLIFPVAWILVGIAAIAIVVFWLNERDNKALVLALLIPSIIIIALYFLNDNYFQSLSMTLIVSISLSVFILGSFPFLLRQKHKNGLILSLIVMASVLYLNSVNHLYSQALEQHQRDRIEHMLGMKEDPLGIGYNVNQSKIAIGSGGISGKGFLQGTQTKYDFVPEQSTDFIFCTVSEEFGFLGSSLVVILFVALILRLIALAERQRSAFSRVYGYAVAAIFFIHVLINIGMTIGLMPVIGIPLPFISYGGSSFMAFSIFLFIFLRLDADRLEVFR